MSEGLTEDQKNIIRQEVAKGICWRKKHKGNADSDFWTIVSSYEDFSGDFEYQRLDLWCVVPEGNNDYYIKPWTNRLDPRSYVYRGTKSNCDAYVAQHADSCHWLVDRLITISNESERNYYLKVALELRDVMLQYFANFPKGTKIGISDLQKALAADLGIDADYVRAEIAKREEKIRLRKQNSASMQQTGSRECYN